MIVSNELRNLAALARLVAEMPPGDIRIAVRNMADAMDRGADKALVLEAKVKPARATVQRPAMGFWRRFMPRPV